MGNATSTSISAQDFILILQHEKCIASHQVWAQISLNDLYDFTIEQTSISDLIEIRDNIPTNFICLAAASSIGFSHVSIQFVEDYSKILAVQRFLWFIRLLLTVPDTALTTNLWFQTAFLFDQSFVPAEVLLNSCNNILFIENAKNIEDIELVKLDVIETLQFFMNASYITIYQFYKPNLYLTSFEYFSPRECIQNSLINSDQPRIFNAFLKLISPCIYGLQSWKNIMIKVPVETLETFFIQNINDSNDGIIPFLFTVLNCHQKYLERVKTPKICRQMITKLLLFSHSMSKALNIGSVFLLLNYIIYVLIEGTDITSKCNELHANTLAELIIEGLTDPLVYSFSTSRFLINITFEIVTHILSNMPRLTDFICLRLLVLFNLFNESSIAQDDDMKPNYSKYASLLLALNNKHENMKKFCLSNDNLQTCFQTTSIVPIDTEDLNDIHDYIKSKVEQIFVFIAKDTFPIDFSQFKISY